MSRIRDFETTVSKLKPFLSEYLKEHGIDPTSKFSCISPSHEDNHPSMSIVGAETSSPRASCFSCGFSSDIFDAAQILEDKPAVGLEWVEETLKYLADKYGVEIDTADLTEEEAYELDTYRAYRTAASLITLNQDNSEAYNAELGKRQWNQDVLVKNGVGTVSSFSDFRAALKQVGFTAKFLDEIDLGRKDIFNPDNMIFTWRDEKGRPVGFTARNLKYEQEKAEAEKNGSKYNGVKYNNQRTTGLKCNIFQKGRRLYGIDSALKSTPPLYIFEGQADVITSRHHRLHNGVALAGSTLATDHVHLLKGLGIRDICICLDGDDVGRKKTSEALDKFGGSRDLRLHIIELPDGHDPDSYLRAHGIEAFKKLGKWTAFEWRLNQFREEDEATDICHQMIPLIVNEQSAVQREELCRSLAKRTGMSLQAIREDLHAILDEKARQRSKERQELLDRAMYEIRKSPTDAEQILLSTQSDLLELNKRYNADALSHTSFVEFLDKQKEQEEQQDTSDVGFNFGPDMGLLQEWLRGKCNQDVFLAIGGSANSGKTALVCKLAYSIATYNEDTVVIFHTIDDTAQQTVPRFVCLAVGDRKLTINQVRFPNYWKNYVPDLAERRNTGYKKVRELAGDGRLIIKDIEQGCSLSFAEGLIRYWQEAFPDKQIVYFLDNFHKLPDFPGKDERVRFKQLSKAVKDMATRLHIPVFSTIEYTKIPPGIRPSIYNVAESVQMSYDLNFMAHLYSELVDKPNSFTLCHEDIDWQGNKVLLPRSELIVDKNKVTDCKGVLHFDFWPASSDYRFVDQATVRADAAARKQEQNNQAKQLLEDDGFQQK